MKKWVLLFFLVSHWAFAQEPLTLERAYQLALEQSEKIAFEEQNIKIVEAKFAGAIGAIFPAIRFKGSEFIQGSPEGSHDSFTRRYKPELRFNAKQPVFQGLREFYALKALGAQKRGGQADFEQAKRLLFMDVVKAFYTTIQLEEELRIVQESEKTLQNRLDELRKRVDLGKSRKSDFLSSQAQLAIQQSTLNDLAGLLANAKEVMTFLIGTPVDHLKDQTTLPQQIEAANFAATKIEERPDVISSQEAMKANKFLWNAQKGELFPTINAEANYYTYRVGLQSDIQWDALFSVEVPIFQGGQSIQKVREAKARFKQSQFSLDEKKRRADLEVKQAIHDFNFSQKQAFALAKARIKSEESYRAIHQDYLLGLTNNLEVLDALFKTENIKRDYQRALAQAKIDYFNLKFVSGEKIR